MAASLQAILSVVGTEVVEEAVAFSPFSVIIVQATAMTITFLTSAVFIVSFSIMELMAVTTELTIFTVLSRFFFYRGFFIWYWCWCSAPSQTVFVFWD